MIGRIPLRVTLVAANLVLVAVALGITGMVAPMALRTYLLDRVDTQLEVMSGTTVEQIATVGGLSALDPARGFELALPSSFFVRYTEPGGGFVDVLRKRINSDQTAPRMPTLDSAAVRRLDGRPFTARPDRAGYPWRVLVTALPDGVSVTVAMTLDDLDGTVAQLTFLEYVVGAATLGLLAAAGYAMVRASLRRLVEVERTAQAIAAGDLTRRVPRSDPRTEVGRLAAALNTMLAEIEAAFLARAASEAAARASEAQMRQFVGDASHELRTPLTSIRGFAELYRQSDAEPAYVIERIERHATRMSLLVDDLLLLARLDQHRPLERRPVDLLALAADAVSDAAATAPGHRVRIQVASGLPAVVVGDEARLRQVIGNLLSNAVRHTPAGTEVCVHLSTEEAGTGEAGNPGYAILDVADDGPGMAPQDAARVFERFYRTDPSRTREMGGSGSLGGSGLGLSIVAALVRAHGGTVTLRTAPGQGAVFTVRLPLSG